MISVELSKRFQKLVCDARREKEVSSTLRRIQEGFGKPHLHTGLGIRKLGRHL